MYESEHDDAYWTEQGEATEEKIKEEQEMWQRQGFHTGMLSINAHLIQMKQNALIAAIHKLGMSDAELNAIFKECVLEQLKQDRKMLIQAKAAAGRPDIAIAQRPGLLGPNGQPFGL